MKIKTLRSVGLALAILAGGSAMLGAAEPAKEDAGLATKLITALENADYDAFVADGEAPFRQFKKEQFDVVAALLASKLHSGYEVSYFGDLKKQGYRVSLWKISFKNGSDDLLATLSVKEGKVGGFYIK
jgi:hypothetical protein